MRTTVTLDRDVERMLRDAMHKSRTSFKKALNGAIRAGLGAGKPGPKAKPFVVHAKPMGLRPGNDGGRLSQLADDLEIEAFLEKTRRLKKP